MPFKVKEKMKNIFKKLISIIFKRISELKINIKIN